MNCIGGCFAICVIFNKFPVNQLNLQKRQCIRRPVKGTGYTAYDTIKHRALRQMMYKSDLFFDRMLFISAKQPLV